MADVTEVIPAAELNQQPPKFVASTEGLQPPMDDNAVRAIFAEAARNGVDDLNAPVVPVAPQGQPPVPAPVQAPAPVEVPAKFQKPDGTVDEEKLQAASKQLDQAIESKKKTLEEVLADYREKEREFHNLGKAKAEASAITPPLPPANAPVAPQDAEALRQQIMQDFQRDPIGTVVELAKAVARKETEPIQQVAQNIAERDRDAQMRANFAKLAEDDPRILDPQNWEEVRKVFAEDPGIFRLKNPHKAAWNEAKERLRLGEVVRPQAQPSNPSPILGRGTPAPVSGLSQPVTPNAIYHQATQIDPYSQEGKLLEEKLRQMTSQLWQ
jgi:hypothetical protein